MKLVRTIPALGPLPELLSFRCSQCNEARTVEGGGARAMMAPVEPQPERRA